MAIAASPRPSFPPSVAQAGARPLIDAIAHLATGCSFEIAASDAALLTDAAAALPANTSLFIPWLRRDTHDDRIRAARAVREAGLIPVPHVAARHLTDQADADRLVARLANEAGVDQLFLIGGDAEVPHGELGSALELLARLDPSRRGYRTIGFAAYPDAHATIPRAVLDEALDTKIAVAEDAGVMPFVVTQFGFDAAPIADWLHRFRARGNGTAVRIGIAGPASVRALVHYARLCGVGAAGRQAIHHPGSLARMIGNGGPDPIITALAAEGVRYRYAPVGLHLFPFGGLIRAARWMAPVAHGHIALHRDHRGFDPLP